MPRTLPGFDDTSPEHTAPLLAVAHSGNLSITTPCVPAVDVGSFPSQGRSRYGLRRSPRSPEITHPIPATAARTSITTAGNPARPTGSNGSEENEKPMATANESAPSTNIVIVPERLTSFLTWAQPQLDGRGFRASKGGGQISTAHERERDRVTGDDIRSFASQ